MDHTLNQFCCDGLKSVGISFLLNQCQVYQYKCRSLVKARILLDAQSFEVGRNIYPPTWIFAV